jgi:hypothetical protein
VTDAESGGTSKAKPNGSAFTSTAPDLATISSLYRCPTRAPGTNVAHTPLALIARIGFSVPSHSLKSPITLTRTAFGAHTANCVPSAPSRIIGCAPSFS